MAKKRAVRKGAKGARKRSRKSAAKPTKKAKKATRKPAKRAAAKRAKKTAKRPRKAAKKQASEKLLTLTEVSKRTGISMPTLQRYKKEHQNRLQTVGQGRTQRYKVESLETFKEIKRENLKKRGRPRKRTAKRAKSAKPAKSAREGLISLSEIGRRTGISYPTLLRYVRLHGDEIPSHGTGRKRRFPVEAVPVFARLRQQSRRGRRKGGSAKKSPAAAKGLDNRLRKIEKSQASLERQMKKLVKALQRPLVKGL